MGNESVSDVLNRAQDCYLGGNRDAAIELARSILKESPVALVVLAQWLLLDKDENRKQEGLRLLGRASAKGDLDARYLLGAAHFEGNGVPEDVNGAFDLLVSAARLGHLGSQLEVLRLLNEDPRVARNDVLAIEIAEAAAKNGRSEVLVALKADLPS